MLSQNPTDMLCVRIYSAVTNCSKSGCNENTGKREEVKKIESWFPAYLRNSTKEVTGPSTCEVQYCDHWLLSTLHCEQVSYRVTRLYHSVLCS